MFQTLCAVITFVKCVTLTFDGINIYIYMYIYALFKVFVLLVVKYLLLFVFCNILYSEQNTYIEA